MLVIFPSDIFPGGNFPKVRLGPLRSRLLPWGGPSAAARMGKGVVRCGLDRLEKLPLGKLHIWEVAMWENTLGKLPCGKNPLGKYQISFSTPPLVVFLNNL